MTMPTPNELADKLDDIIIAGVLETGKQLNTVIEAAAALRSQPAPASDEAMPTNEEIWNLLIELAKATTALVTVTDSKTEYRKERQAVLDAMKKAEQAGASWHKPAPEVDEATLLTRELAASLEKFLAEEFLSGKLDDKKWFQDARAIIAEALSKRDAVPEDVWDWANQVSNGTRSPIHGSVRAARFILSLKEPSHDD